MNMPAKLTLKQWRVIKGVSAEELQKKTMIPVSTIYYYENDVKKLRKAKYETVLKISEALGISVDDILLEDTSENPK